MTSSSNRTTLSPPPLPPPPPPPLPPHSKRRGSPCRCLLLTHTQRPDGEDAAAAETGPALGDQEHTSSSVALCVIRGKRV